MDNISETFGKRRTAVRYNNRL